MQLTRFDRWLREKFVYELHILTLRPPESIPAGIRAVDLPDAPGKRYKHLFIAASSEAADELIRQLKENNQMFTAQIVDREAWYVPFIAPKEKSVTWWLFSVVVISTSVFFALLYLKSLVEDPEFRKNFMEALELLKG
ncbi:MAG: hypothetical protein Q8Q59_11880 [Luteolibacter sp.]|jgi:hypothetical protein|nr:hypothetical protein [Luteolibacter sp.]